ncbi:MAG: hypothetical protein HUU46_02625 [Candidatus Hydrogenedentes bacterium]|nr:hypothetical protein [Candidatus Hydrogenedentota bacterium]
MGIPFDAQFSERVRWSSVRHMEAHDEYIRILRAMTPEQKLRATSNLYWAARDLKAAWFRSQHPEWSEEQVQKAVRDAFLYARD